MTIPTLQVWSAPKCEAGAVPIAALPAQTAATITETAAATDDSGTFTLPADVASACGVAEGRILRASFPLRGVVEWVMIKVTESDPGATVTVTLGPLRLLLAWRGFVRDVRGAETVQAFTPAAQTVSEFLTRYVLSNLADDGLSWLSLGTVEYAGTIEPAAFANVRRGELLTDVEQLTGYEVSLRRLAADAGYAIDVLARRNSDADTVLFETPGSAQSITRVRDLLQTATAVVPIGTDDRPMGEVDWIGGAVSGSGPYWIPLTDPAGGAGPIAEDDQFVGAYLALPGGTTLAITESRASDSAVQVASVGAYVPGQRVCLWDNTTGRPVSLITSPTALASNRGRVVARVSVKGARTERTLNQNGGFDGNALNWTITSNAAAELPRSEFPLTLTGSANGARSAGVGTGTPFPVTGFPANTWMRRGDRIVVDGVTLTVTADAVPDTSGALSLSVSPGLPATYADDTPLTLQRVDVRNLQWDGTISYASWIASFPRYATFKDVNTDGLQDTENIDGLAITLTHTPSGGLMYGAAPQYVSGNAGKITFQSSGFTGTPPANFTDGDAFVLTIPRETRTLRLSGSHSSGAVTLNFKPVSALARRDWTSSDTLYAKRSISGTALVTAFNTSTLVATITTGSSTLDDVASADRDGIAQLVIDRSYIDIDVTVYGGSGSAPSFYVWTVSSISGSSMTLSPDLEWIRNWYGASGVDYNGCTLSSGWPQTFTASWSVVDTYPVGGSASWGSNGRATVAITVPSGRTIPRGTKLYANWIGGGSSGAASEAATPLYAHAAVTGSASSIVVAGWDGYRRTWDGTTAQPTGVYRVFGGTGTSRFVVGSASEVVVGTSVQLNGSGAGNVTLAAANVDAIANGAALTVTRPTLLTSDDRTTGSGLRLLYAPGTPTYSTPSAQSSSWYVTVPPGDTRVVRGVATINVRPGTIAPGSVAVALVDLTRNVLLASGTVDSTTTYTALTRLTISVTATVAASGLLALRVYGGSDSDFSVWHYLTAGWWYVAPSADDAVLSFADGARSRVAFQRGQAILSQRKGAARYAVRGIDRSVLTASGTPVVPGQSARLRSAALALDTTSRIVRLTWAWPSGELLDAECEAAAPRFTDVTVSL